MVSYSVVVVDGVLDWGGEGNHGASGEEMGQASRESSEAQLSRGALGFTSFVSACCFLQ